MHVKYLELAEIPASKSHPWRGGKIQRIFDEVVLITIKNINHNSHKSF